ncbi:MAG: hypothetical protein R3F20_06895 [Planctomycetota bacterium]
MPRILLGLLLGAILGAAAMRLLDRADSPPPEPLAPAASVRPAGSFSVTGIVIDENGERVPNLALCAVPRAEVDSHAAVPDLEDARRRFGTTRTDADGAFRFDLPDTAADVRILADDPQWFTTRSEHIANVRDNRALQLAVKRARPLTLDVRDENGRAPDHATFDLRGPTGALLHWTPREPTVSLPLGPVEFLARADARESEVLRETIDDASVLPTIVLRPVRKLVLSARFPGPPPPRWGFRHRRLPEGVNLEREELRGPVPHHWAATEGETIEIRGLEPGRHAVMVVGPLDEPLSEVEVVELDAGPVALELEAGSPDLSRYVVVTALGPDGHPLLDWDLRIDPEDSRRRASSGFLDAQGRAWFRRPTPDERGRDGITLEAHAEGLGTIRSPLAPDDTERTLRFRPPARFTVRLVSEDPERRANAWITVTGEGLDRKLRHRGEERPRHTTQPGRVRVAVTIPRPEIARRSFAVADVEFDLTSGDHELTIDLDAPAHLVVHVPAAPPDTLVTLRTSSGWEQARTKADRSARFDDVAHGEARVTVRDPAFRGAGPSRVRSPTIRRSRSTRADRTGP